MRTRRKRTPLLVVALVVVLAAGGGVATALYVVPRATGALRAVTAATVYAEADEASPEPAGEQGSADATESAAGLEPEVPVGPPPRQPIDAVHEREKLPALPPAAGVRKVPTNPAIALEDVEVELVEGAAPWVLHRMVPGETLVQVASRYEVTPEALRTWNGVPAEGELEPGARVKLEARRVPPPRVQVTYVVQPGDSWWSIATTHAIDSRVLRATNPKAADRLTVGDSLALWIDPAVYHWVRTDRPAGDDSLTAVRRGAVGIGRPWEGRLVNGVPIPAGEGWRLQQPTASYGTTHAVESLVAALQAFAQTSKRGRPLLVGAMSLPHGGPLPGHRAHQTGRDVDIRLPLTAKHPEWFPIKPWRVDYEALWHLVAALADTGEIEVVLLDYELQKALHKAATSLGADEDARHRLIQWPRGRNGDSGLVRHAEGQTTQLHVRFRCGQHETECTGGQDPPPTPAS